MPIILPPGLPAIRRLDEEGIAVFHPAAVPDSDRRAHGDHRDADPLRILLVNLMPDKPRTEWQFARLLGRSSRMVKLTLTMPQNHVCRTTETGHLERFYVPWRAARWRRFDGMIVTGAPVERMAFEAVDYWPEFREIADWALGTALRSLFVCWSAQAALYHRYGVPKHQTARKRFGIFRHSLARRSPLARGLGGTMPMPVSRHAETRAADLPGGAGLTVGAVAADGGLGLVEDPRNRSAYLFDHPEYDGACLLDEYRRDRAAGRTAFRPINHPHGAIPDTDTHWHSKAGRLMANWLDLAARDASRRARSRRRSAAPAKTASHVSISRAAWMVFA